MAMNLEAVLKIAAQVTGLQNITALEKGLQGAEKAASAAKGGFKAMLDSSAWQAAAAAAAGIGVALGLSVRAAMDFESAMADVKKVVPGLESAAGFSAMKQEILGLSRELPVSAEGLAQIMAAAGQAGIAKEELTEFTKQAAQMGVAFDISAAEAGEAMAKLRTALGLNQQEVVSLADAMNYLSNNMASSAAQVNEFMLRAGAVGKQVAMTTEQTAAFGSAMIAAGAAPEVASTSFMNLIRALTKGESATARQSEAFKRLGLDAVQVAKDMQKDAVGTIRDVFLRISKMPAEMRVATVSEVFGDEARALTPLITNMKLFDQAIGLVADKSKYAGSMLAEFNARAGTSANNWQILQNNVKALQIAIGDGLLPAINLIFKALTPLLSLVADLAGRFPVLTAGVTLLTAAIAALVFLAPGIVGIITLLGQLGISVAAIGGAITQAGVIIAGLQTVAIVAFQGILTWITGTFVPALIAVFSAITPAGWIALAIVGIGLLVIAFREQLGNMLKALWEWGEPIRKFWVDLWDGLVSLAYEAWVKPWIDLWQNVLRKPLTDAWKWIQGVWQTIVDWWNAYLVKPITNTWNAVMETIKGAMAKTAEFLKGVWDGIIGNIKNVARGFLNAWINAINTVIRGVNTLIKAFNRLPGADIPVIKELPKVAFAQGGVVKGPTLALIGEAGPEYVIPEAKMGQASANYLGGKRGGAVIPAFASGGYVGRQPYAVYRPGIGGREPEVEVMGIMEAMADAHKQLWEEYLQKSEAERKQQHQDFLNASKQRFEALKNGSAIEVTTGPVMEFDGSRFIAFEEFNKALQEVQEGIMRKAQDLMMDPFVNQWRGV